MPFAIWPRPTRLNTTAGRPLARNRRTRRIGHVHQLERLEHRYALAAQLTTTPITWEVLGLDSSKPNGIGP